ncbi:phage tail tip fiber protein [Enterobacter hormaechei]|uniref:phage tail tip fiber protein n=1 Tax=Enterobacter hormaechei TaxID=158836 RepID=UPI002FF20A5B
MKHLPLKAVMIGLDIIETDEGYELHSPAGEAKYDAWGARREVNGIPEYFPSSISMKKRVPAATDVKKTESIALSGAATDVLYALFFRGALQSGDLPAKSGAAELRELGFAETRHTATEYQKENYFTFLTAEGQEFAIKHLADTRFGKPVDKQYRSAITIGVELDTSDVQKTIDELDDKIRNSDAFKVLKDGWSFEKNGTLIINNGQVFITDAKISDGVLSTNYNVKLNDADKGKPHEAGMTLGVEGEHSKVEFLADRFKVNEAAQSASNNEETAFNGGLAFGGFPGAISHDGANPADGNNATAEPISSIASATGTATKARLTDEMQELVLKAVRESDLFTSLQTAIAAKAASTAGLQQAVNDAVSNAIRNALKPGGLLYGKC